MMPAARADLTLPMQRPATAVQSNEVYLTRPMPRRTGKIGGASDKRFSLDLIFQAKVIMSEEQKVFFEQRYQGMSTEELVDISRKGNLTEVASQAMDKVLSERDITSETREAMAAQVTEDSNQQQRLLGTRWLSFCTYYQYPVGGLATIWAALGVPIPKFPMIISLTLPLTFFLFAMAYGLHRRRIWAWKANWGVMVLGGAAFLLEQSSKDLAVVLITVSGIGIWGWLSFIYWSKRRELFS